MSQSMTRFQSQPATRLALRSQREGKMWLWQDGGLSEKSLEDVGSEFEKMELSDSCRVLPTGFDLQTHLRFPGQPEKETLQGGLWSAFAGGYDTVVSMPNTKPFLDTPSRLKQAIEDFEAAPDRPQVRVLFTGSATEGMQGDSPADIDGLVKAGAVAITDDGWGVRSSEAMKRVFELCRESDVAFLQHAEMPGHGGVATASDFQRKNSLPEYPRTAESEMIERDLNLLKEVPGARYHVLHVSTVESLDAIRKGKEAGLNITCEVTPHHLYFCNEDIPDRPEGGYFKMNPPLFSAKDRAALKEALAGGLIDCVSTDHAPHEKDLKQQHWEKCPFGTRGLVTALPVLLEMHQKNEISWERLIEVFSFAGRKILGATEGPNGFVVVDFEKSITIDGDTLPGLSENSCFAGYQTSGAIRFLLNPEGFYQYQFSN